MKKIFTSLLLAAAIGAKGQSFILKAGDRFPDVTLHPMVNAPVKSFYLDNSPSKKFFILNFWGTWCSPCLPEMDAMAKLQTKYQQQIQIIGVSNDSEEKLKKYIAKKPSQLWLASDTSSLLYQMFSLASVGYSAIIDSKKNIVAVVNADSVNSKMIDQLLRGDKIKSSVQLAEVNHNEKDPFGIDSLQSSSFTVRSYMKGEQSRGQTPNSGPFANRRKSYFNITLTNMYKDAYDVVSEKQIVYDFDKKKYADYNDKSQVYCFDLLVKPEQKDSLLSIMQRKLNESMPVKGRTEMRTMQVYILKQKQGAKLNMPVSASNKLSYGFSGRGFDGTGVTVSEFAHLYLTNELDLPVVDETGLTQRYDIKTTIDMRDKDNMLKSIDELGLAVEKAERPVKVLILYAQPIVGYVMGTYK